MPIFAYKARDDLGAEVKGVLVADTEEALASSLRERRLYLVQATPRRETAEKFSTSGIDRRDIIVFALHLSTVLAAGIPIVQGLEDLERHTGKANLKKVVARIREDLQGGSSLSRALERFPQIFPEVFVSMVMAGEVSGAMDMVLRELTAFLEWQEEMISTTKRATFYPAFLLVSVLALASVLFTFVFPRIMPIFENMKVELPLLTRIMIAISKFFESNWLYMLLAVVGLVVGVQLLKRTPRGRFFLDGLKLKVPLFGQLITKLALSRFSHNLGILLRSGIDIIQSLTTVERLVGNVVIAKAISDARERVIGGGSLWRSFEATGVFPPLVIRMIATGEVSGTLEDSLQKVTDYYDRDVPDTIKRIFAVMEPMLIFMLAMFVVVIALSFYLPLYSSLGAIGAAKP